MITTETKIGISNEEKQKIANDLRDYVETQAGGSRSKASRMLKKVSLTYISQILNGKWEAMSDDAWTNLRKQVSVSYAGEWVTVEDTVNYQKVKHFFEDARQNALTFGIISNAGYGKTQPGKVLSNSRDTFLIRCNEYFNRRAFLTELLKQIGIEDSGYSISAIMQSILDAVRKIDRPLIIIDEADKLSDQVLYFFISLYNALEDQCGLVLMGAPYLQKRIEEGAKKNKKGYKEILSRLGGKFIKILPPPVADQRRILNANGIYDELTVTHIINDSDNDLRRVRRLVRAFKGKETNS